MRVAVIGAGLAGVATAYELVLRGHEVVVVDRRPAIASESSFAPAGLLAPGLLDLGLSTPAGAGARALLAQAPWLWRHWRARSDPRRTERQAALHALASRGRDRVQALATRLRLDVQQAGGVTVLLTHDRDVRALQAAITRLGAAAPTHQWLDAPGARALVPALAPQARLRAALHLPQDGVGNTRLYAQLLKDEAQQLGAQFRLSQTVRALKPSAGTGAPVQLDLADGAVPLQADAAVLCTGAAADALLHPLGIRLPLAAAQVHALTAPLSTQDSQWPDSPQGALLDARSGTVLSRIGPRLRVSGAPVLGRPGTPIDSATLGHLYRALEHWLPGVAQLRTAQAWKGQRALLPDGAPVLGPAGAGARGLWLNLGHDLHGWPLACGAAMQLAAQIDGTEADASAPPAVLGAQRWG